MNNYALCPISPNYINERVARLNSLLTILLLTLFVFTQSVITVLFLALDFLLRASGQAKFSPVFVLSSKTVEYFKINKKLVNAGPKLFAARIGLLFSVFILLSLITNADLLVYILAGILGFFSFLEAAFGFCVACTIYPFLYKLIYHKNLKD